MECSFEPIGIFHGSQKERYHVARQGGLLGGVKGRIELFPRKNYEQALEGLEGFDQLWVIYQFHRNKDWKPKVMPPRGERKQGVFATRSPHRPNFIGLSRVRLLEVKGLVLTISEHDLLDGTPILDIKPYLNYCDAVRSEKQGWLDELEEGGEFSISWSEIARKQVNFLFDEGVDIPAAIEPRLLLHPFPRKSNRIRQMENGHYEIAFKSWRVSYVLDEKEMTIQVLAISSGYHENELNQDANDRWGDFSLHRKFQKHDR